MGKQKCDEIGEKNGQSFDRVLTRTNAHEGRTGIVHNGSHVGEIDINQTSAGTDRPGGNVSR